MRVVLAACGMSSLRNLFAALVLFGTALLFMQHAAHEPAAEAHVQNEARILSSVSALVQQQKRVETSLETLASSLATLQAAAAAAARQKLLLGPDAHGQWSRVSVQSIKYKDLPVARAEAGQSGSFWVQARSCTSTDMRV